jgi:tRNA/tmRNA/rRNA uracil-C5-methylase (TrmA/RlmC/RlmD family)
VRIVHICCGTDEIPREVEAWAKVGYRLRRAVPLDLFAGTINLETMLLFTPAG